MRTERASRSASPEMAGASRAELEEERTFLLRSIEDLDAEHGVGDITDDDHRVLRDRYTARAATVLRALRALDDAPPVAPGTPAGVGSDAPSEADLSAKAGPGRRRRRRYLWAGVAAFAVAAVVLVVTELTTRLPGQTASGSISLDATRQLQRTLDQAQALETAGKGAQALALYRSILAKDPTQEQALAESGWLEFEAGVAARNTASLSQGQRDEEAAERADPGAYAPHLYLGSMLLVEQKPADAAAQFARFLSSSPPADVVARAWPFVVRAYTEAGKPAPALPPGVTATSAP